MCRYPFPNLLEKPWAFPHRNVNLRVFLPTGEIGGLPFPWGSTETPSKPEPDRPEPGVASPARPRHMVRRDGVVHLTYVAKKTPVIYMDSAYLSHINHWAYNPLTIRGMNQQVTGIWPTKMEHGMRQLYILLDFMVILQGFNDLQWGF